jgi:hypothetical protein
MAIYNILFIGDYFSLVTDIETDETEFEKIATEASNFINDYYDWEDVYTKSKQIIIRDEDNNELGEV